MRLLTLNLRHGGGRRMPQLLRRLLRQDADVLVLSEHRNNEASALLRAGLAKAGYRHQAVSASVPRINHLLLAARRPLRVTPLQTLRCDTVRLLAVRIGALRVVGVHLPNLRAKLPHWGALLRLAPRLAPLPAVYMGDFNTGHNVADVQGAPYPFTASEQMAALEAQGWVDAWRRQHPAGREYTWYSHRARGFRLDHAFLSPALAPALRGAHFDHAVRERGESDHSALIVELADD